MINYKIIRSQRKTIAIHILPTGEIEVRAPKKASKELIEKFINLKEKWIEEKVNLAKQKCMEREEFSITTNDTMTFLGKEYPVVYGKSCSFDNEKFSIPEGDFSGIKPIIIKLYKKLARIVISERVDMYSKKTQLIPSAVRINSAVTRWGSCSGKNSLNFSWKLIFAPLEAVDYVVVHELSHIKEHNHSIRFWRLVESILPDYREREKQLKILQDKILRENWA